MELPEAADKIILSPMCSTEWFGTSYTMRLYTGCSHDCVYCSSRAAGSQQDFACVQAKNDALSLLRSDLRTRAKTGVIYICPDSDAYVPLEQHLQLTRGALELLCEHGFGAMLATKSNLILRDIDVLKRLAAHSPVLCALSLSTCSKELARKLEPGAPPPKQRLQAVRALAEAGLYTGVLMMPVLPFIQDSEENIREVIYSAAQAGARFVYPMLGMTLERGQREYYYEKLGELFPRSRYADAYCKKYATRYKCFVRKVQQLTQAFRDEVRARGLLCDMRDITAGYQSEYGFGQLSFL